MNSGKCNLILSSNNENKKIELNVEVINHTQVQKRLGVHIDYKLKFDTHIETICKKVRKKLHVLARIVKYMSTNQEQLLLRSFITSQFNFCPLTWMCHSRRINNQVNKLHERALRLVYNDKSSSFRKSCNYSSETVSNLGAKPWGIQIWWQTSGRFYQKIFKNLDLVRNLKRK